MTTLRFPLIHHSPSLPHTRDGRQPTSVYTTIKYKKTIAKSAPHHNQQKPKEALALSSASQTLSLISDFRSEQSPPAFPFGEQAQPALGSWNTPRPHNLFTG